MVDVAGSEDVDKDQKLKSKSGDDTSEGEIAVEVSNELMEDALQKRKESRELPAVNGNVLRPFGSPSPGSSGLGSATSNDHEDNFFGSVSAEFIRPGLSGSAASDDFHETTMNTRACSLHYRSLARSESGGDLKTPTAFCLSFDEKTPSNDPGGSGSLMSLTKPKNRTPQSPLSVEKTSGGEDSNDMSIIEDNPHWYDYAMISPRLDALLAEGSKGLHADSVPPDIKPQVPISFDLSGVWKSNEGSSSSAPDSSQDTLAYFQGSFEEAKGAASVQGKWLLVNLQSNTEFSSHMLNRDTWANEAVSRIIRTKFIFWQAYDDTIEGKNVCSCYKLESTPVVLIIDPIRGEKMRLWKGMVQPERLIEVSNELMEDALQKRMESRELPAVNGNVLRPLGSPSPGSSGLGSATSNDDKDNFFGSVSAEFIRPGLSGSAASDDFHETTMNTRAFLLHYRSLARSESGGDLKTPTAFRLIFDENTPSNDPGGSGSLMSLTKPKNRTPQSRLSVEKTSGGEDSNDMSIIEENPHRFDYARISPRLDALLAEGSKGLHADSVPSPLPSNGGEVAALDENGIGHMDLTNVRSPKLGSFDSYDVSTDPASVPRVHLSDTNGHTSVEVSSKRSHHFSSGDSIDDQVQTPKQLIKVSNELMEDALQKRRESRELPAVNGTVLINVSSKEANQFDASQLCDTASQHINQSLGKGNSPKDRRDSSNSDHPSDKQGSVFLLSARGQQSIMVTPNLAIQSETVTPSSKHREWYPSIQKSLSRLRIPEPSPRSSLKEASLLSYSSRNDPLSTVLASISKDLHCDFNYPSTAFLEKQPTTGDVEKGGPKSLLNIGSNGNEDLVHTSQLGKGETSTEPAKHEESPHHMVTGNLKFQLRSPATKFQAEVEPQSMPYVYGSKKEPSEPSLQTPSCKDSAPNPSMEGPLQSPPREKHTPSPPMRNIPMVPLGRESLHSPPREKQTPSPPLRNIPQSPLGRESTQTLSRKELTQSPAKKPIRSLIVKEATGSPSISSYGDESHHQSCLANPADEQEVSITSEDKRAFYTVGPLPQKKLEFTVDLSENGSPSEGTEICSRRSIQSKTFLVELSYAAKTPLNFQPPANMGCLLVRQPFFRDESRNFADAGAGIIGVQGFHSGFHPTQGGLSLSTDASTSMDMTLRPVTDFLMAKQGVQEPRSIDWIKEDDGHGTCLAVINFENGYVIGGDGRCNIKIGKEKYSLTEDDANEKVEKLTDRVHAAISGSKSRGKAICVYLRNELVTCPEEKLMAKPGREVDFFINRAIKYMRKNPPLVSKPLYLLIAGHMKMGYNTCVISDINLKNNTWIVSALLLPRFLAKVNLPCGKLPVIGELGSGGEFAGSYLRGKKIDGEIPARFSEKFKAKDAIDMMMDSLSMACLNDPSSGGLLKVVCVQDQEITEDSRFSVQVLLKYLENENFFDTRHLFFFVPKILRMCLTIDHVEDILKRFGFAVKVVLCLGDAGTQNLLYMVTFHSTDEGERFYSKYRYVGLNAIRLVDLKSKDFNRLIPIGFGSKELLRKAINWNGINTDLK